MEEISPEDGLLPKSDPNSYSATQQFFSVKNNEEWKQNQPSLGKFLSSVSWYNSAGKKIRFIPFIGGFKRCLKLIYRKRKFDRTFERGGYFFVRKKGLQLSLKAVSKSMDWRPLLLETRQAMRLVIELVIELIHWLVVGVVWRESQLRKRWK